MNRKQRREFRKDKNLIIELYSIINKYLPELLNRFYKLSDIRIHSYVTYNMKTICMTKLFRLICSLTSLSNNSSDEFNTDLDKLPYCENIQDVFVNMKLSELMDI